MYFKSFSSYETKMYKWNNERQVCQAIHWLIVDSPRQRTENWSRSLRPQNVCDLFTADCSPYNLRGTEFTLPGFNSVTYENHSLRYLGPKMWNALPEKHGKLSPMQTFKKQIIVNLLFINLFIPDCK